MTHADDSDDADNITITSCITTEYIYFVYFLKSYILLFCDLVPFNFAFFENKLCV